MMSASSKLILLLALCSIPLLASADVLMLKDGRTVSGNFMGADQSTVSFQAGGQTRQYRISDINSITFTSPAPAYTPPPSSGYETAPSLQQRRSEPVAAQAPAPLPAPAPRGVSIHAGSLITVRMIDPVDSSVNQVGETFRASLDEPLMVDGDTIVPRGADVTVKLVSRAEAGRVTGRSELTLALMDINVQGRRYEITTSEVSQAGGSRGKQSAERVGGGAALGAVIGAIAGGGKGAAVGAAAGGGAGTAVQLATKGQKVKIPAETRLQFTLAQPLNL
jgi:hypothetical protein